MARAIVQPLVKESTIARILKEGFVLASPGVQGSEKADIAPNWFVRDGGNHETTGTIFLNLCLILEKIPGITLDWRFCWHQNHTSISMKEFDETLAFLKKIC